MFKNISQIKEFKASVKNSTFKGNPLRIKYDKAGNEKLSLANTYIKYVKSNKFAPLPSELILNPTTNRIVKRTSILTNKGNIKKQYANTLAKYKGRVIDKEILPTMLSINKNIKKGIKVNKKKIYKKQIKSKIMDIEYGDKIIVDLEKIDIDDILDMLSANKDYLVETDEGKTIYSLNKNSIQDFLNLKENILGGKTVEMSDSNEKLIFINNNNRTFKLKLRKPKKDIFKQNKWVGEKIITKTKKGEFWNYYNTTDYDLERYGIFKSFDKKNYIDNCFVMALKMSDLPIETICSAEDKCYGKQMEIKKIKNICSKLRINIKVKFLKNLDGKVVSGVIDYGVKGCKEINMGLINNHYFLNEDTNYKNTKGNNKTSWTIIKCLWDNKEITMTEMPNQDKLNTIYANEVNEVEYKSLKYNDFKFGKIYLTDVNGKFIKEFNEKKGYYEKVCLGDNGGELKNWECKYINPEEPVLLNVFFDFETVPFDNHKAWCCVSKISGHPVRQFFGEDCGKQMLEYNFKEFQKLNWEKGVETKNEEIHPRFIAHNLNYDYNFIQEIEGLSHNIEAVIKDNKIYTAKGFFFGLPVRFECSLMKMGMLIPLSGFKKNFGITQEKDVCPYGVYTITNILRQHIPVKECLVYLKPSQHKLFLDMVERVDAMSDRGVDIIKYGMAYCVKDVEVLEAGYNKYRKLVLKVNPKIDINNFLTLASMAQEHFVSTKCYDGIYKIGGIARNFLQKFVVGGRTMLNSNKVQTPEGYGVVYDARSLYPTAMKFMGANGKKGILNGKPKIIEEKNLKLDWLEKQDGYFVLVNVLSVGIKREFPILSYIDEKSGVRIFSNEMEGKLVYVDRFTLEDFIEFQDGKVEFIQGYFFDEGRNNTICDEINRVYETRSAKKKAGCPTQLIYKLFMNSAYGKTIMKAGNTRTIYRAKDEIENYISKNFDALKSCHYNNTKERARIEEWCSVSEHFSSPQVGSEILSYSKRVMNRLMCCAEDNGIKIFYQDTDSIHMRFEDVAKLKKAYLEKAKIKKYDCMVLDGEALGNFHIDLESDIVNNRAKELNLKEGKDYDLVSQNALFLNKKDYCESMIGVMKDGTLMKDKDDKDIVDYSIHIKGIPELAVWYKCNKEKMTPIQFFQKRYNYGIEDLRIGKTNLFGDVFDDRIKIDCLKTWCREKNEEWSRCSFEFHKNHTISNRENLVRTVGIGECY